jgi:dolichol kinase
MLISSSELKRKIVHNLSLVYLLMYWVLPRWIAVGILTAALIVTGSVEFIRLRRPEVNAWFLKKFGGIHRESEVLHPSGIYWTLLGAWLTMLIFTSRRIVIPALGFLVFGDTAAALGGQRWGEHPWKKNPRKTIEGSVCFAVAAIGWALLFVRWPVAILSGLFAAWIESLSMPWNDNLWIPVLGGVVLSILNLAIGRHVWH